MLLMFVIDMSHPPTLLHPVDGHKNTVSEIDVISQPELGLYGNSFAATEKILKTEKEGIRTYDATKARSWKISNAEGKTNSVNEKPTAYKLMPFTKGSAGPTVLTAPTSAVSMKGEFATANLWVTPHNRTEKYPAGEYTPQGGKFLFAGLFVFNIIAIC